MPTVQYKGVVKLRMRFVCIIKRCLLLSLHVNTISMHFCNVCEFITFNTPTGLSILCNFMTDQNSVDEVVFITRAYFTVLKTR